MVLNGKRYAKQSANSLSVTIVIVCEITNLNLAFSPLRHQPYQSINRREKKQKKTADVISESAELQVYINDSRPVAMRHKLRTYQQL